MRTTIQQSIQADRSTLWGMLGALAAMIMVLVIAASLAPSASAETPAERCKRETSAYNAAWAAIGKKPPVPYKCGGNNEPPPTLSPTTPEEEPDETSGPTTDAPEKGSQDNGPSMTAPTERRELEHPDQDQATIGTSTTANPRSDQAEPKPSVSNGTSPSAEPYAGAPGLLEPHPVGWCPLGHNDDDGCRGAGVARGAWKWTKCVAAVGVAFVPTAKAYKAIKALGGVKETARLLWGAGNAGDFLAITGGVGAEILGINGIKAYCFE